MKKYEYLFSFAVAVTLLAGCTKADRNYEEDATGGAPIGDSGGATSNGSLSASGGKSSVGGATATTGGVIHVGSSSISTGGSAPLTTVESTSGGATNGGTFSGGVAGTVTKGGTSTGGVSTGGTTTVGTSNVNECQLGTHNCDTNASCADLAVGYQCTCLSGFVGDGRTCRSCAIKNGGCDSLTTCSTVGNTIVCGACPTGYANTKGDGTLCSEINECTAGTSNCDPNAICTNTTGSFTCACPTGWSGNGKSCVAGVKSISVTGTTNCALKYDGNVWCWGAVAFVPSPTPNAVPLKITTLAGWDSFYWDQTRCGIRSGALYCWGNNNWGSAGVGTSASVDAPTQVGTATDWTSVSGNSSTTCGIRAGQLYCWGYTQGRRSSDTQADSYNTPQKWSTLTGWQSVDARGMAMCGIRSGELYCWGSAFGSTLGDGATEQSPTPIRVGTYSDWTVASFGGGIRLNQLYTWGDNFFGKVGNGASGSGVYQTTPLRIGLAADWTDVSTSASNYVCGVRGGLAYCWGNNNSGELGIGTLDDPKVPTQITVNTNWQTIQGGSTSTCGIAGYKVYCWGENYFGQVGDGTTEHRQSPVAVVFP